MMKRLVFALLLVAAATGCGYTTHSSLDEKYQSIYVAPFQNQSKEYDLQAPLTNAVIRKFEADGRLDVVPEDQADLILEGLIIRYARKGIIYDAADDVTQYIGAIAAGVRLTDRKTGEVVWEDRGMTGETSYYTRTAGKSSDRLRGNAEVFLPAVRSFSSDEENRAAAEALEQLASDIFYRTVEPW